MDIKALELFVAEKGQTEAGRLLGVSPPAISKALAAKREITVFVDPDGSVSAKETRSFPSRSSEQRSFLGAPQTMNQKIRGSSTFRQSAEHAGILSSTGGTP